MSSSTLTLPLLSPSFRFSLFAGKEASINRILCFIDVLHQLEVAEVRGAAFSCADEIYRDFDRGFICWYWNLFLSPLPSLPIRLLWDTDGDLGEGCCFLLVSNLVADGHCGRWVLLRGTLLMV